MTSTSFNVGLTDSSRLSSRVLRPPGGGHTDIFGGEPEPPRGRRAGPPQPPTHVIGQGDEPKPTNGTAEVQNEVVPEPVQAAAPAVTAEAPVAHEAPEAKAPEAKTPEAKAPEAKAPAPQEAPRRVRVPPGGFSSGLWDGGN